MPCMHNVDKARPLQFLYVPAISNVVTNGNGTGTKNVLWNRELGFVFSIQSSVYSAITVAKITTYSLPGYGLLYYVSVEIDAFRCKQMSTQTNLLYLGLVNVTMIAGTRCS